MNIVGYEVPETSGAVRPAEAATLTDHKTILNKLLDQVNPVNFAAKVFPETLNKKHLIVLTVSEILKLATRNGWQLCRNNGSTYLYNGAYWQPLEPERIEAFLGEAAEKMGVPAITAKFFQFRESLYKQFEKSSYLPSPEPSKDTVSINLLNGTFEFSPSGTRFKKFDPANFLTYQLPFNHDPAAKATKFKNYLDRVLPDIERQKVLAEFLGFVFIRHGSGILKEEKAAILYGTGANGKSVFFEIVSALFGRQNVSNFSLRSLTEERGFYRAQIENKLLNYCAEISNRLEAAMFKSLCSGEPIEAAQKYGQPYTMTNYAKLMFNTNELPRDVEHTTAFFRRFLIIPFDQTIPEAEQNKSLHTEIINTELSGVFNWVLAGLRRLISQKGFTNCEASRQALETYKTESDSVKMFIDERQYVSDPDKFSRLKELYSDYRQFCSEDGFKPYSKRNFKRHFESMGFISGRESGTGQIIIYLDIAKPF